MLLELHDDLVIIFPAKNYHVINLFITHVGDCILFEIGND